MQNVWYHLRRPTLVRRIIIAQMLLLTLLWCLFLTFILWEDLRSPPILTSSKTYETVLPRLSVWTDVRRIVPPGWKLLASSAGRLRRRGRSRAVD